MTRKVTLGATRIKEGLQKKLVMGNLDAKRDWGFAGDYVRAMWLMLQQEQARRLRRGHRRDAIPSASCSSWPSRCVDLDYHDFVEFDPKYTRPSEVDVLLGDATKARQALGWKPEVDFRGLVKMMIEPDLELARRENHAETSAPFERGRVDRSGPPGSRKIEAEMELRQSEGTVLVACPDARPPAYQAVIGLHRAGRLRGFLTACYYDPGGRLAKLARRFAPGRFSRIERILLRRHDPEIPRAAVRCVPSFDLLLRLEARLGDSRPARRPRTGAVADEHFDRQLARTIERARARGAPRLQRRRLDGGIARSAGGWESRPS